MPAIDQTGCSCTCLYSWACACTHIHIIIIIIIIIVACRDGSYSVAYRLTRAGAYRMEVRIADQLAASAPYALVVHSDTVVPAKTFVYGSLLSVNAGEPAYVYAQTRDRYEPCTSRAGRTYTCLVRAHKNAPLRCTRKLTSILFWCAYIRMHAPDASASRAC